MCNDLASNSKYRSAKIIHLIYISEQKLIEVMKYLSSRCSAIKESCKAKNLLNAFIDMFNPLLH